MITTVALGDLLRPAKVQRAGGGTFPLLSMTMHGGLVDQSAKFKKRVASSDISDYKVIKHGQLVVGFPIDEGVLDFQTLYDEGVVSPAYGVWDLSDDTLVHRPYLKKFLRSGPALAYYEGKLRGSTARRRSLPAEVFLALPVPLPPFEDQRRIAAILDQADALRTRRCQVLAQLDALIQAIFDDMFGRRNDPLVRLDSLVDDNDRINYGVVQPGDEVEGGVPLIRVSNLVGGGVDRSNLKCISQEIEGHYQRSRIKGTEILISSVGSIGSVSTVSPADVGSNLARAITRVPIADPVQRHFVASYLRTQVPQRYFTRELRTVAQPTLNVKQLAATQVPLPPTELQREYVARAEQVATQRTTVLAAQNADAGLIASLQSRAFRGEL